MAYYNYIEPTGTIVPDTSTVRDDVAQLFKDALGANLDTNPSTIQGRLIDLQTNILVSVINNNAKLGNQINPDLAEKNFLDSILALTGATRGAAEPTTVTVKMTGQAGTLIPAGTTIVSTDSGLEFSLFADVTIDPSGSVDGDYVATVAGPDRIDPGEIVNIVSGPLGLETVTNLAAGSTGTLEEDDFEARSTRKEEIALNSKSNALSIIAKVSAVAGVKSVAFRENVNSTPLVVDTVTLKPHSTYIVVDGGLDFPIAEAYYIARSGGSGFNGSVIINYPEPDSGQDITIQFDRPALKPKEIKLFVKVLSGSQPTEDIQQSLIDYSDTDAFAVGVDISSFDLANQVSTQVASIFINKCEIAEKGSGIFVCGTIDTLVFEKATIEDVTDIEVIYV